MHSSKRQGAIAQPQRQCQYAAGCYRKNPQHFAEYAHKHRKCSEISLSLSWIQTYTTHQNLPSTVSDIRQVAATAATSLQPPKYVVPDDLFLSRDIVIEQLAILDRLYPLQQSNASDDDASKRPRISGNNDASTSNSTDSSSTPIRLPTAASTSTKAPASASSSASSSSSSAAASTSSAAMSQADQLAAYRARHSAQPRPAPPAPVATTSTASTAMPTPRRDPTDNHTRPPPKNIGDYIAVVRPRGQMAAKLRAAAPYNFFLTAVTAEPLTHDEPLTVTFQGEWMDRFVIYQFSSS